MNVEISYILKKIHEIYNNYDLMDHKSAREFMIDIDDLFEYLKYFEDDSELDQ